MLDPQFGHVVNHDFAEYHIATIADVGDIEARWIEEHDPHVTAVANAACHATGIRVRDLPLTPDEFLR